MKLTPWFTRGEKPARDGVYQQMCGLKREVGYQKFSNGQWGPWARTPEVAARAAGRADTQNDKWRGLAGRPK